MEFQESWLEVIGDELLRKARSLSSIGVNGVAWAKNDALSVVEILRDNGYAILGGDVLEVKKESVRFTYDNWYADKVTKGLSAWGEIVAKSCELATKYVGDYREGRRDIVYQLVAVDSSQYERIRAQKK